MVISDTKEAMKRSKLEGYSCVLFFRRSNSSESNGSGRWFNSSWSNVICSKITMNNNMCSSRKHEPSLWLCSVPVMCCVAVLDTQMIVE